MADETGAAAGVVVIDTNATGEGRFSYRQLAHLVRVRSLGHIVVAPEVVVWEWTVHAYEAAEKVAFHIATARDGLDASLGLAPERLELPAQAEVEQSIRAQLADLDIEVWPSSPAGAVEAIRDQVLQEGVGTRSKGIRTGAADGLVMATVVAASERFDDVLLWTRDKRLADVCTEAANVRIAANRNEVFDWCATRVVLTDATRESIVNFIHGCVSDDENDSFELSRGASSASGIRPPWPAQSGEFLEVEVHRSEIDVESIAVDDVEIFTDGGGLFATATVTGEVELDYTAWTYDEDWDLTPTVTLAGSGSPCGWTCPSMTMATRAS